MKPVGPAVVFLAVINLVTVSSTANVTDATSSETPGHQDSSSALTNTTLIPISPTGSRNVQNSHTAGPTVTTEDVSSMRTSRKPTISTVSSPTEENLIGNTTDGVKIPVTSSTAALPHDKIPSTPPTRELTSIGAETTSTRAQVTTEKTSIRPSAEPQTKPTINHNDPNNMDKKTSNGDVEKLSSASNRGIKIGAGCVAAVIAVIVLVVIYKICQKKPPAAENAEMKVSAATKENVTLVSVKSETPNSDTKRTSSNQMEGIEC